MNDDVHTKALIDFMEKYCVMRNMNPTMAISILSQTLMILCKAMNIDKDTFKTLIKSIAKTYENWEVDYDELDREADEQLGR